MLLHGNSISRAVWVKSVELYMDNGTTLNAIMTVKIYPITGEHRFSLTEAIFSLLEIL